MISILCKSLIKIQSFVRHQAKSKLLLNCIVDLDLRPCDLDLSSPSTFNIEINPVYEFDQGPNIRFWFKAKTMLSYNYKFDLDLWPYNLDLVSLQSFIDINPFHTSDQTGSNHQFVICSRTNSSHENCQFDFDLSPKDLDFVSFSTLQWYYSYV